MSELFDQDARRRIESDLDTSFMVEAAAGTGKTTSLVRRLLAVIGSGVEVERIVAVTFTDKAAGEMKLRLRSGLEQAKREGGAGFERAIAGLEQAHVSTIHRFAADLLRKRPVQAGIDPRFALIAPQEARGMQEEAFYKWLERALTSPAAGLRRVLARDKMSAETLLRAARELIDHRHLSAPWARQPWSPSAEIAAVLEQAEALWARASRPTSQADGLFLAIRPIGELLRESGRRRLSEEELEAELCALAPTPRFERLPRSGFYNATTPRAELLSELTSLRAALSAFAARASADLACELRERLQPVVSEYEAMKARRGALDFADVLQKARDLVAREPDVLAELRAAFSHVFIDEFQDTDLTQAELLTLLSSTGEGPADQCTIVPGKLFLVGDPKQSIYRFRDADPAVYERVKRQVLRSGGALLHLSRSFRSVPGVIDLVNAAFAPVMDGDADAQQAAYVALTPSRSAGATCPPVVALPVPTPYGKKNLSKAQVRASLPSAIAGFVRWLTDESGYRVVDPTTGEPGPIAPHHVAVLFRQFESYGKSRVEPLSLALTAADVPHVVLGDRNGGARSEAHAVIAALVAIEHIDDPLAIYAALHGLLFGFSDAVLFEWRERYGGLRPARPPITALPEPLVDLGAALRLLFDLHKARNRRAPIETLHALLGATRAHVGFGLAPSAEQAFLQLAAIEQTAAIHEKSGGLSYRAFLELFAEGGLDKTVAVDDEADGGGGVRIITVHRAKGLEYPVVILADPATDNAREPERFIDSTRGLAALRLAGLAPMELRDNQDTERRRAQAEGIRTAYVAATRARDLLVVPFVGDEPTYPEEGWLRPISAALRPVTPAAPVDAAGMSGGDVVLVRPATAEPRTMTVSGLHRTAEGCVVLVFDPLLGGGRAGRTRGIRELDLITKEADASLVEVDQARFAAFLARRAQTLTAASEARHRVETITARSHAQAADGAAPGADSQRLTASITEAGSGGHTSSGAAAIGIEVAPRRPGRPRGKRFGTFVHNVLALVDLRADAPAVAELAGSLGRLLSAGPLEIEAAAIAAKTALEHRLFDEVRGATAVYREFPLTWTTDDGAILDGVVDLAFERREGVVVVVDFKTDDPAAIAPELLTQYKAQVALYCAAIGAALGCETEGALLFV